jgi:sterol desaturase/sphingolipid hydroxylase (fatty acid hydroxylase superfamily)
MITTLVIVVVFTVMLLLERWLPLRRETEPKVRRIGRNLTLAVLALLVGEALQLFWVVRVAAWVERQRAGVVPLLPAGQTIVAVLLLDYTLWWWHWLNHRVPFFWRFHLVHHIDRDLDASTALRFHFGEHALSIFFRSAQIVIIGASAQAVWIWQTILFASILFHHANVRLPIGLERVLVHFIVTPRMHGIHHSNRREETNSNWSSMFSWWDFVHRTLRLNIPQAEVTIGVPAYPTGSLKTILIAPFVRQRDDWDGKIEPRGEGGPLAE